VAKVYETGNKNYVIRMACRHAVDCVEVDIESLLPVYLDRQRNQPEIDRCKAEIRDFKKLIERSYP